MKNIKWYCCLLFLFCSAQSASGQTIYTIAGIGASGHTGDGGPATAGTLHFPFAVAADARGDIYVADFGNHCVRKISPSGILSTFAGTGSLGFSGDGGPATAAIFNGVVDVAVDRQGNVYVSDQGNYRIRKVDTFGIVTTIAGTGTNANTGDGGPATDAAVAGGALAIDTAGNIYFGADTVIRKISTAGIITRVAGSGGPCCTGDGGPATAAGLDCGMGLDIDKAGAIYMCSRAGNVRKIDATGVIRTIAGGPVTGFSGDGGPATLAKLSNAVEGVRVDDAGNVYITDRNNNRIRKVDALGIITTFAGNLSTGGYYGDGGPATDAALSYPQHVAKYGSGNIYIADRNNNAIRMVTDTNHAIHFNTARVHHFNLCTSESVIDTIFTDSVLAVSDRDTGQVAQWSIIYGPFHGTATGNYVTYTTGGTLSQTGVFYTPYFGYAGFDTIKARVTDGFTSDTTAIYLRVDTSIPMAGTVYGIDSVCLGDSVFLADTTYYGILAWSSVSGRTSVNPTTGALRAISAGYDTIRCVATNACGVDTTTFVLKIRVCEGAVHSVPGIPATLTVYPNPANRSFVISFSSAGTPAEVVVVNSMGAQVKQISINNNVPAEVSGLPPGAYFIHVHSAGETWIRKVVVE